MSQQPVRPNPHIFRAYDVRGLADTDLNSEVCENIGLAFGQLLAQISGRRVVLGRDNRESSPRIKEAAATGLMSSGADVTEIGESPTPMLYFAVAHWALDGGVIVTGSHNPIEYNGLKLVEKGGIPISPEQIQEVRQRIEACHLSGGREGKGSIRHRPAAGEYLAEMKRHAKVGRPLKLVVDAGNGMAGPYAPPLLREIGCEVVEMYCEPDPHFPHHLPDPEIEENVAELRARVVAEKADLGLAYDGDMDRIGLIDEKGERYEADYLLILLARDLLTRHPGATVIADIKSSQNVLEDVRARGGQPLLYRSGHSLIKRKMREDKQILLGGEVSGHMFFAEDYYGLDDALLASIKIVNIVSTADRPMSALLADLPKLAATPEIRVPCPDENKFEVAADVAAYFKSRYDTLEVDGARVNFEHGWALVRPSNTNPYLSVRFEGKTEQDVAEMKRIVYAKLREYPSVSVPKG